MYLQLVPYGHGWTEYKTMLRGTDSLGINGEKKRRKYVSLYCAAAIRAYECN